MTLYGGILNALQRFAAAAAAPILLNLSLMVALALAAFFPDRRPRRRLGRARRRRPRIPAGRRRCMARRRAAAISLARSSTPTCGNSSARSGPAIVGSAGVQLALFADTIIASFLPAGALSALYYADRLNQLPIGVIGIAAGTVVLPEMSRRIAAGDQPGAAHAQNRAIEFTLLLSIPCVVAFFVIPDLIMRALFMRGAFTAADADAAAAHAHGLCLRLVAVRADPQRGRDLLCARRHRDAGEGGADRGGGQYRIQGPADGTAGAGRPGAGDLDRRLDQSRSGHLVCDARRSSCRTMRRLRQSLIRFAIGRRRAGGGVVAVPWRRSFVGSRIGTARAILPRWPFSVPSEPLSMAESF